MKRVHGAAVAVLAALAISAAFAPSGAPAAGGVWDARDRGCYCHSSDASSAVGFTVAGLVGRYVPGANYTLVITVVFTDVAPVANRSQGGFHIEATAGVFSVPASMQGLVQVDANQATHTMNGSMRRDWAVNWTAPATPDQAITFYVFVNTVNGNRSESLGTDHWTSKTILIGVGDEPQVTGPPAPRPPFALETYGVLIVAVAFGAFALWMFKGARKVVGEDTPDNRGGKPRRKRDAKK